MNCCAVILAAGQGTRMKSETPKVLHRIAGQPLLYYSLQAVKNSSGQTPVVVIGHGAEAVKKAAGDAARFAVQEKQLGTGNAVQAAESLLKDQADLVLVISADMPLFQPETLQKLIETQSSNNGPITLLTVELPNSHGFGRIVRSADDRVTAIVEEAQATPQQLAIRELNVGAYCFDGRWLWDALKRIAVSPKGEYYLTDTVELAVKDGLSVCGIRLEDPAEAIGINTRVHLAEAEAVMRKRINESWMEKGVTMIDPARTYIEASVEIGADTIIYPDTYLRGKTSVGSGCAIGPNTIIEDSKIGASCTILASVLEGAVVEDHVGMGPFCHLRKNAHLGPHVHMGNFGEVKDSYLGAGTKMGHFSYIGNATIGEDVNIGAGTITCNFDGEHKHPTVIGDHVFIGSDTMLVAPLKIGDHARTGAGAVVTKDIAAGDTAVGVPARPLPKKDKNNG